MSLLFRNTGEVERSRLKIVAFLIGFFLFIDLPLTSRAIGLFGVGSEPILEWSGRVLDRVRISH